MENWRFIEENPDYMISDHGRVLSFKGKSKLILCTKIIGTGYETVSLLNKGICTDYNVHRLIAKAFIPNPKHLPQINHLDGNTMNNHVSNLAMVRCIHQHDARHPHRITPHRNRFPQNSLRRNGCERNHFTCLSVYERNGQRGTPETVTPTLAHPATETSGSCMAT